MMHQHATLVLGLHVLFGVGSNIARAVFMLELSSATVAIGTKPCLSNTFELSARFKKSTVALPIPPSAKARVPSTLLKVPVKGSSGIGVCPYSAVVDIMVQCSAVQLM